jgi:uncharacterized protein (TIGR04255 family)
MEIDAVPTPKDLPNKPLIEALFELRWKADEDPRRKGIVSNILLGKYYDRIRKTYPVPEELPAAMVPEEMVPYIVRHRFRAAEKQWPLTQLGLGILTINESEKYTWDTFRPRIEEALHAFHDSFPTDIIPLTTTQLELRYINFLSFDVSGGGFTQFLRDKLHINISVDDALFGGRHDASSETDLSFSIAFKLAKPVSVGTMSFGCGENDKKPGILWQIIVRTQAGSVPQTAEDTVQWANDAHDVVEHWFFKLSRGELLRSFQ